MKPISKFVAISLILFVSVSWSLQNDLGATSVFLKGLSAKVRLGSDPFYSMMERYLGFAYISYCTGNGTSWSSDWSCFFCDSSNNATIHKTFDIEEHNLFGYIATTEKNETIISFRGTERESIDNWISNLKIWKTELPYEYCDGCKIHSGFFKSYGLLKKEVRQVVSQLSQIYPENDIIVTGHSLGGAISTLAAIDLRHHDIDVNLLITYGSPRIGNKKFATWFSTEDLISYRVVHQKDIIAKVPPKFIDYHHVPREVWFYDDSVYPFRYKICNYIGEDDTCSGSFAGGNSYDHSHYFNLSTVEGNDHQC
eukprot:TRINITY_DN6599_c0_g1_i2.p1 TRINITY_DN6599_c0_g1~~TRINITY_DN6599_c0_g1_i2.p1  ORF type:complete len:310 (-),score=50.14 TRINITY_DN6599_c0_g1_i2:48-977(-)